MAKYTTEHYKSIDIRWLSREHLRKLKVGSFRLNIQYTWDSEELNYEIKLDTTPCNYGGFRYWFLCPNCNRRVVKLYLKKYYWCRHCHNLTYRSCQEHDKRFSFFDKDMRDYTESDCREFLKLLN